MTPATARAGSGAAGRTMPTATFTAAGTSHVAGTRRCQAGQGIHLVPPRSRRFSAAALFVCLLAGAVPVAAQTHAERLVWGPSTPDPRYGQFTDLTSWPALAAIDTALTAATPTITVSGGGNQLQAAITTAESGALIEIADSATYDWVIFEGKSRIYVRARVGQYPKIVSNPSSDGNSNAVVFLGANENIGLQGLTFLVGAYGNGESTRQPTKVGAIRYSTRAGGTRLQGLLIQDCRFEPLDRTAGAVVALQLVNETGSTVDHGDVAVRRTVFDSTGTVHATADDLAAVTVTDFQRALVANVHFKRSSTQPTVSQMRGARLNVRNGLVEYAYCEDIGNSAVANECVYISGDTSNGTESVDDGVLGSGTLTTHDVTVRNSIALSPNRAFAVTLADSRLVLDHCVVVTGAGTKVLEASTASSRLTVTNSVFLELTGTSQLLTRETGAVFTTDYNLYNWRGSLGFNVPGTHDKSPGSLLTTNCDANCDPQFVSPLASDFRLLTGSPAIKAGSDGTDMGPLFYSIDLASRHFEVGGGTGYVNVTASGSWTTTDSVGWITPNSTSTVIGNATSSYRVDPNTSSLTRTSTVYVAGIPHTVTQDGVPCSPSLGPSALSVAAAGGTGYSVTVTPVASDCTWTATSGLSWVTVASGATGTGTGTVFLDVAANTSSGIRSGSITIAGRTFTIEQDRLSCNFQLTPTSADIQASAVSGLPISLRSDVNDCTWSSSSNDAWLQITSGGSGVRGETAVHTVTYRADANPNTAARTGTLRIAGLTFTVRQEGVACTQQLSATGAAIGASGGPGARVTVTSSAPDCNWTAAASLASPWLTVTSSGSMAGSTNYVEWAAEANTSSLPRTGSLVIAGQTYTVEQAGRACAFTLSSSGSGPVAAGGTVLSVGVSPTASDCTWTAASNVGWMTAVKNSVSADITVAGNASSLSRTGTLTIAGNTYTVTQSGKSCGYSLTPDAATIPAAGGTATVTVGVDPLVQDCTWSATSNNTDWITATAAGGTVSYTVTPNPRSTPRTGTINVAGRTFTVTQSALECSFTLSKTSIAAGSTATTSSVNVVANAPDCTWTIAPGASWITLAGATARTGSDTVSYTVTANTLSATRSTTLGIAGQAVPVTQDGATCTYNLASSTNSAAAAGATATVKLTAGATDCNWTTTSNASWITVSSGATRSGTGDVTMTIASNASSGKARTGTVTIAGLSYTVNQAGVACTFTVPKTPTPATAPASGGAVSLPITTTPSDCEWTMASDAAWLTAESGSASGSGSRTLSAAVAANSSSKARTGNLTVTVGTTSTKVAVAQAAVACTYALGATEATYDSRAAAGAIAITPNATDCVWTASRGSTAWITLDSTQGTGSGLLTYKVLANATTVPRQATLQVAGVGFVITQGPAPCSVSLSSTASNVAATANQGTVTVTAASTECSWTATSGAPWISLTAPTSSQGNGALKFSVAANPSSKSRTGTITVNDKTYTVTQAGAACTYTFDPATLSFTPAGGDTTLKVTASVDDCEWTATPSASWIVPASTTGTGTTSLKVAATANTTTKTRTGSLAVGGKSVSVSQSAQGSNGELFTRYLAEGATSAFFNTRLALLNPGSTKSNVTLRFLKTTGETVEYATTISPTTRLTLDPRTIIGNAEFSTEVESSQRLIVDRTMTWDARAYGSHAESAVQFPAEKWYLAEGSTAGFFDLFYLVQNPNSDPAHISVQFLLPGGAPPVTKTYTVPPNSRFNVWVNQIPEVAHVDSSGVVTSDIPVIVERAMYLSRGGVMFLGGHGSAGVTAPATEWFLAEGATGAYFDTYVLIANPTTDAALVQVSYLLPGGSSVAKSYVIDPLSRFSIWVDQEDPLLADTSVSTIVRSTNNVPVIVERAMWWPGNWTTWTEAHNSAGTTATATKWAMAEGEVGGSFESTTYVLIANTGAQAGQAKVTLMFESGTPVSKILDLPANSRTNVCIGDIFKESLNKRFGIVVESLGTNPAPIVVERAMYTSSGGVPWAAGTNAVATPLP